MEAQKVYLILSGTRNLEEDRKQDPKDNFRSKGAFLSKKAAEDTYITRALCKQIWLQEQLNRLTDLNIFIERSSDVEAIKSMDICDVESADKFWYAYCRYTDGNMNLYSLGNELEHLGYMEWLEELPILKY